MRELRITFRQSFSIKFVSPSGWINEIWSCVSVPNSFFLLCHGSLSLSLFRKSIYVCDCVHVLENIKFVTLLPLVAVFYYCLLCRVYVLNGIEEEMMMMMMMVWRWWRRPSIQTTINACEKDSGSLFARTKWWWWKQKQVSHFSSLFEI